MMLCDNENDTDTDTDGDGDGVHYHHPQQPSQPSQARWEPIARTCVPNNHSAIYFSPSLSSSKGRYARGGLGAWLGDEFCLTNTCVRVGEYSLALPSPPLPVRHLIDNHDRMEMPTCTTGQLRT